MFNTCFCIRVQRPYFRNTFERGIFCMMWPPVCPPPTPPYRPSPDLVERECALACARTGLCRGRAMTVKFVVHVEVDDIIMIIMAREDILHSPRALWKCCELRLIMSFLFCFLFYERARSRPCFSAGTNGSAEDDWRGRSSTNRIEQDMERSCAYQGRKGMGNTPTYDRVPCGAFFLHHAKIRLQARCSLGARREMGREGPVRISQYK